jgi:acetyltransferase-like isoleucine patch superfamily enzyme
MRFLYLTIYGAVKYLPTPAGDILRYAVLKLFMKRLKTVWIHEGATFHWPAKISIGRRTSINENVMLNGYGGIEIGDMVAIGSGVKMISAEHGFQEPDIPIIEQRIEERRIQISDNVYIGFNAVILGGVSVARGAVIGAGAVVTKDIPENAIVAGVPAEKIGDRSR